MDIVDLTGKEFGDLTVIEYIGKTGEYRCKKYGTLKGIILGNVSVHVVNLSTLGQTNYVKVIQNLVAVEESR